MLTNDAGARSHAGGPVWKGQNMFHEDVRDVEGIIRGMTYNVAGSLDDSLDYVLRYMSPHGPSKRPGMGFACL